MVNEEYAILEKVKAEVAELNVRKSGLAKECNVQLLEADKKAKAIIASAQDQANSILKDAGEVVKKAHKEALEARTEGNEYLHQGKKCLEECRLKEAEIGRIVVDFNAEKMAFDGEVRRKNIEANNLMAQANELKKQVSEKEINVNARIAQVIRREDALVASTEKLASDLLQLKKEQDRVISDRAEVKLEMDMAKDVREANGRCLLEIDEKNKKFQEEVEATSKLADTYTKGLKDLEDKKKSINSQFEILEKTNKDIEEKNKSLGDKMDLLNIKNKELDEKLEILKQTRKNK